MSIGSPEHLQHCMLAGEAVCVVLTNTDAVCYSKGAEGTGEETLPFSQGSYNDLLIETPKFCAHLAFLRTTPAEDLM